METRELYGKLYANKLDKLQEMNKFLETHKFPKLIQEIENLNGPAIGVLQSKNLSTKKIPGSVDLISEFRDAFKELLPVLLKLFQKIEGGIVTHMFCEVCINLIPKSEKKTSHGNKIVNIPHAMPKFKKIPKLLSAKKLNPITYQRDYLP